MTLDWTGAGAGRRMNESVAGNQRCWQSTLRGQRRCDCNAPLSRPGPTELAVVNAKSWCTEIAWGAGQRVGPRGVRQQRDSKRCGDLVKKSRAAHGRSSSSSIICRWICHAKAWSGSASSWARAASATSSGSGGALFHGNMLCAHHVCVRACGYVCVRECVHTNAHAQKHQDAKTQTSISMCLRTRSHKCGHSDTAKSIPVPSLLPPLLAGGLLPAHP